MLHGPINIRLCYEVKTQKTHKTNLMTVTQQLRYSNGTLRLVVGLKYRSRNKTLLVRT